MSQAETNAPTEPRPLPGQRRLRLRGWWKWATVALLAWFLISWGVAYRLTHRRRAPFAEALPQSVAACYESPRLKTRDGFDLGAWYAEGRSDAPSVILLHGNGGRRWNCLDRAEVLRSLGYPVLLVSLRGHGDSTGDFNDFGLSARADVIAAVAFLERRRPGRPIVVLGTSLGAAAALFASGELGPRVQGYILESPYRDLRTAVWHRVEMNLPPLLDWFAYQSLVAVSPLVLADLDRIAPARAAHGMPAGVPVLILAGAQDPLARPFEAEAVLEPLRNHGRLIVFERAGHLDMIRNEPDRYWNAVLGLIAVAGEAR